MQEKNTSELEKELSAGTDLSAFMQNNALVLQEKKLSTLLEEILRSKNLNKADVIRHSGINSIYAYQIFSGSRLPSRDKLLCLCFGMKLTAEETQRLLKIAGFPSLYIKQPRDCIILHALYHRSSIIVLNEQLFDHGESLLE